MHLRTTAAMTACALSLFTLGACSSDDEPSGEDDTNAGAATPTDEAEPEPSVDTSEFPTLPTDLPTDLPTEVDLGPACAEVSEVLTDGITAMQEVATDPTSATELFGQLSTDLRSAAADSNAEVAAAAEQLAAVYDEIGAAMAGGAMPDVTEMTAAATALTEACSG